ncbi:MAG: uracil phosphoribosyltransferase [Saprospiraceae bacterium]|nr:uracil phosphoribosyltransferase [Saprospiraceae bacterium]
MIYNLSENSSIVRNFITEMRDKRVQQDRARFRFNMRRLGQVMAYEISKQMPYLSKKVETPLATTDGFYLSEQPVLATILRAGLALHEGLQLIFDQADCAYISAYRKHIEDGTFDIELNYVSSPEIAGRQLIISDPMLATGSSLVKTLRKLYEQGMPEQTYIVTAIASEPGINYVLSEIDDVVIYTGAIDPALNDKAYILPGLGDAGDLAYGPKIQE